MKIASVSGSSNIQMLPSLLPLPASFFKVLLHPLPHPWFLLKFLFYHNLLKYICIYVIAI